MGMFDYLNCKYPLAIDGANDLGFQTKDTPAQQCDQYEIREDGTLWHEAYDREDQSPATKWKLENPGLPLPGELQGLLGMRGMLTPVNHRWEPCALTGSVEFYTFLTGHKGWIEFRALFENGKVLSIETLEHTLP